MNSTLMNLCLAIDVLSQNKNAPRDNPSRGFPFDSGTSYVPTSVLTFFCLRGIILSEIKKGTNQNEKIRQKKKVLYDS